MRKYGLLGLVLGLVLTGCSSYERHPIDFGPSDVEYVETYMYKYRDLDAHLVKVDDLAEISIITDYLFKARYVKEATSADVERLGGADVTGYRFHLTTGEKREITKIWVSPTEVLIAVAGQPLRVSDHGHRDILKPGGKVSVSEAPKVLP